VRGPEVGQRDGEPNQKTDWRRDAADAAHAATVLEAEDRWQVGDHPANYRWTHVQRVVRLALRLAELTGADGEVVEAAAWLHDIAKKGRDDDHGVRGSIQARAVLTTTDFPRDKIDAVVDAIAKHVGLWTEEPVTPLEAAVVWDADKLSKLGVAAEMQFLGGYVLARRGSLDTLLRDTAAEQAWQERTLASFHSEAALVAGRTRWRAQRRLRRAVAAELCGDDLAT